MKRLLLLLFLCVQATPLAAGSQPPANTLLFFYQDGCPWCARMDALLREPAVSKGLARHDRVVRVNVYQDKKIAAMGKSGKELSRFFNVTGTPTLIFLNQRKKVFLRIPGALERTDFLDIVCQYHPGMREEALCDGRGGGLE